jgi:RNA polymerase sigma-70 factor (ECF subfamily)
MAGNLEFAELVDRYYGSLYRFAMSLTGAEPDACDLVQQTFYIWVRKGSQLEQPGKVKSWLFTTLHREFLQLRRRSTRFPEVTYDDAEEELPSVGPADMSRMDGSRVVELMQGLDPAFLAVVALFYLEDHSYEEIALLLELPMGTVKSRLSRGIAQLRRRLAADLAAGGRDRRE